MNERKRFGFFAHVVSTALKHTFNEQHLKEKLPEVYDTIQGAKALVTYMKYSGLVRKLSKTLLQHVDTRWNSHYNMLLSVFEQFEDIVHVLDEKDEGHRYVIINREILLKLVEIFKPWKQATVELEADLEPTFHKIF